MGREDIGGGVGIGRVCEVGRVSEVRGFCTGNVVLDIRLTGTGGFGFAAVGGGDTDAILGYASGGTTGYVGGSEFEMTGVCRAEDIE